jgi:chromosome segregation ATPase
METMNGIHLAVKNGLGMIDTRLSESSNLIATWTESMKSYSRERDSDRIDLSSQEPEGSNQGTGYLNRLEMIHSRLGAIEKEHQEHRHMYEQLDHYVKKYVHKLKGEQQAMEERVQELEQRLEQKVEQLKKEQEQHRQYALQQQLQQQMHQMQQQMLQLVLQQQQQQQQQQNGGGGGNGKSKVNGTVRIDLDGEDEVDT